MRSALITLLALLFAASADAAALNRAPDFNILSPGQKTLGLRSFRGQPVVLLIADSVKNGAFKKQLKNLQGIYQELASKGVVIVAALARDEGPLPTNVPVAVASDGVGVGASYGVQKGFLIAIIGRDGNLDCQTAKVLPAERVRDVVQNSSEVQISARKGN